MSSAAQFSKLRWVHCLTLIDTEGGRSAGAASLFLPGSVGVDDRTKKSGLIVRNVKRYWK